MDNKLVAAQTQEDYEQFMLGFRLGYPVEGDAPPTVPDTDNAAFQLGLAQGQAAQEPEDYYCGLHGFVPISHFPCTGE